MVFLGVFSMGKTLFNNKLDFSDMTGILPVNHGGTGVDDSQDAGDSLNMVRVDQRNAPMGVAGLDGHTKMILPVFPPEAKASSVIIDGLISIEVNSVNIYNIVNYSRFNIYTVNVSAGNAVLNTDTGEITFTAPSTPQSVIMSVNDSMVTIDVTPLISYVHTPSIISPIDNSSNLGPDVVFTSSAFVVVDGSDTHEGTDWQLSTNSNFSVLTASIINSTTNKTSWSVTNLTANTTFYVRVRHKGTSLGYSNWSIISSFVTKAIYLPNTEQAKIIASDGLNYNYFGNSVAISADGNRVAIGAPGVSNSQGAVYIFNKSGSLWVQDIKFTEVNGQNGNVFGECISMSDDGNYILIGAESNDIGGVDRGAAYIYSRSSGTWALQTILSGSDSAAEDHFGNSVDMSRNGDWVIVGAKYDDVGSVVNQGSAYVFHRVGTTWTQSTKLTASDGAISDQFGYSVGISDNGDYAVVGAWYDDISSKNDQGSAYVFSRSGSVWIQQAKLVASDGAANDQFGVSIAISDNGEYVAVGAWYDDTGSSTDHGSVYIFVRSGTSWTQQAKLVASDGLIDDRFGCSVSISTNGDYIIIGVKGDDIGSNYDQGTAYIFTRSGTTWIQQTKLTASDGAHADVFGHSVAISSNGRYAIVGAPYDDIGSNSDQGSAYIFA